MNLSERDQYLLERYFSDGRADRSSAGAILDHCELYSVRERHNGIVDARPTAEVREHTRSGPDDGQLAILGMVSRRLSVVRKTDPASYLVLSLWFGDTGAKYALTPAGRLESVVALTATGMGLVRRMRLKTHGADRSPDAHIASAVARAAHSESIRSAIGVARVEAVALVERACEAWRGTEERRKRA